MIKNCFITGLILLAPLTITLLLVIWIFYTLSEPFYFLYQPLFSSTVLSRLLSLISAILILILVGFFAQNTLIRKGIDHFHAFLLKIPLFRNIYGTMHELIHLISRSQERAFSEIVLLNHPSEDIKIVGFIPRKDIEICPSLGEGLVPVYIPGTVNPLMGFLVFTSSKYVNPLNISTKDAFVWTVSLGTKDPFEAKKIFEE